MAKGANGQRRAHRRRPGGPGAGDRGQPPARRRRPAAEHRRPRPRQGRHRHRRARLHHGRRRAAHQRARRLGARRRERPRRLHPHLVQRLPDRRRQPARRRAAPGQRPPLDLRPLHRPAARPGRHERGRGARPRQAGAGRRDADDPGRPGARARRDPGLHEGAGRRRDRAHPRRLAALHRRRRDRPHAARGDGRRPLVQGDRAGGAHPSDRERADPDPARIACSRSARPEADGDDRPPRRARADRRATLGHYDASAEAFWDGTRDHDVRQNIAALLRHLEGAGPFAILDLGCGPGRDLATFRDLGHEAIGVDGAARFVEMARAHSGCEVWQQNLLALALPAGPLRRHLRQRRAAARARERAGAGAGRAAHGAAAARRAVQLDPARPGRGRLEQRPLQRLSRAREPGSATAPTAGFVELEHYYRPEGRPREQQPWLASVWRRGDDPPR